MMKQRSIAGFLVGEMGLGLLGLSQAYGPVDDAESLHVLERAIELGYNFWDTGDWYGAGKNEILVGKALKKYRQKVFLATKVGIVYDRSLTSHQDQVQATPSWIIDGTPDYIRKCIDLSLERLGVEHIDLYILNRVDPLVPIEESVGAMADLVTQGKVLHLALSEASADAIRRAYAVHPITALQSEYSLWTRHVEADILPTCRELGLTFIPSSPMGRGFLSGTVQDPDKLTPGDLRRGIPRFQGDNLHKNMQIIPILRRIAEEHRTNPAQIALAWVLAQGEDLIPIPGTKHVSYLEENLQATGIRLTGDDMKLFDTIQVYGERFPKVS